MKWPLAVLLLSALNACVEAQETRVFYWGPSSYGAQNIPPTATNIVSFFVDYDGGFLLRADKTILEWPSPTNNDLGFITNVIKIAKYGSYRAALCEDGTLKIWSSGEISSTNTNRLFTYSIPSPTNITDIAFEGSAGSANRVLLLRSDGSVRDENGILRYQGIFSLQKQTARELFLIKGDGGFIIDRNTYSTNFGVISIARAGSAVAFVKSGGSVVVTGTSFTNLPTTLSNVIKVCGNYDSFTALRSDGTLVSWGPNHPSPPNYPAPTNLSGVSEISTWSAKTGSMGFIPSVTAQNIAPEVANILASDANFLSRISTNSGLVLQVGNLIGSNSAQYGLISSSSSTNFATKTDLTNALAESRTDGINNVLSNPNLWTLYTTNQIKTMALGDLMLTRTNNGQFVLNYDIEQSDDLVNWAPYQGFLLPLTNLPTDKAFLRIKLKSQP
jgi:hypothetical protein